MSDYDWLTGTKKGWNTELHKTERVQCLTRNRLWIPPGQEKKIVFLSNELSMAFWEHSILLYGSWRNYATCLCHLKIGCPLDKSTKANRYECAPFTIIEIGQYTMTRGTRKGETIVNPRRLLVAKADTLQLIARKAKKLEEQGQHLRGAQFTVFRGKGNKTPSTGTEYEFDKMVDVSQFPENDEFNYAELFKPSSELVLKYVEALEMEPTVAEHEHVEADDISFDATERDT